jgi:hypothetical protein
MGTRQSRSTEGSMARLGRDDYWTLSTKPLHSFFLLSVFVAAYEAGTLLYLTDNQQGVQHTVRAKRLLEAFFTSFGVAGFMAAGLAMLTVLLVWHMLSREKWTVRPAVLAGMALEAALWALPLVVFGAIFQKAAGSLVHMVNPSLALLPLQAGDTSARLMEMPWQARATIAIGAGIYEETLFRLIGIALLHFLLKDLLQAREVVASSIAVAGAAVAFALYHDVSALPRGEQLVATSFYFVAGVYFGTIYLTRGFGIVVAAHAIYDVLALVVLARPHA